jgi:hypothetical protein
MQELHLLETSELHFLYSDEEAQALSVILVWALARPAKAARAAADATKKLVDGMVEIVDSTICIKKIYTCSFFNQIDTMKIHCSRSRSSRS